MNPPFVGLLCILALLGLGAKIISKKLRDHDLRRLRQMVEARRAHERKHFEDRSR